MIDQTDEQYKRFCLDERFKIVTVCRLDMDIKGLDRVALCAKALKEKGAKFLWYIIGDGPDKAQLEEMIVSLGIESDLCMIGKRMNPFPFIAASDIMCMPSRFEGKPMVITESMILGTPPVVTEYLAAHEQIDNGIDGIIVSNEDESIQDAILKCINDKKMISNMSEYLKNKEYGNSCYITEIEKDLFE